MSASEAAPGTRPRHRLPLAAIAASPLFFLAHDLEEYLAHPAWLRAAGASLPPAIRDRIPPPDVYGVAFALLFAVQALAALAVIRAPRRGAATLVFALLLMGRFTNVLTHTAQAVWFSGYTPGVATAWVLVMPFVAWLLWRFKELGWVRRSWLPPLLAAGFVIQFLAITASLALASWLL